MKATETYLQARRAIVMGRGSWVKINSDVWAALTLVQQLRCRELAAQVNADLRNTAHD